MNKILKDKIKTDDEISDYDITCGYLHNNSLKCTTFYYKSKLNEYESLIKSRSLIGGFRNKEILYSVRDPFKKYLFLKSMPRVKVLDLSSVGYRMSRYAFIYRNGILHNVCKCIVSSKKRTIEINFGEGIKLESYYCDNLSNIIHICYDIPGQHMNDDIMILDLNH